MCAQGTRQCQHRLLGGSEKHDTAPALSPRLSRLKPFLSLTVNRKRARKTVWPQQNHNHTRRTRNLRLTCVYFVCSCSMPLLRCAHNEKKRERARKITFLSWNWPFFFFYACCKVMMQEACGIAVTIRLRSNFLLRSLRQLSCAVLFDNVCSGLLGN